MTEIRRALFLFPTDRMGGAERITRTLAREAATSGAFDVVVCFVLCRDRTGTLDALAQLDNVQLHYTLARNSRGGLTALLRILSRIPYDLVFSSHTHLNAACSAMRWAGLLRTKRLVSRESTLIFARKFTGFTRFVRLLYYLYGKQDLIVCQSDRMRESVDTNTRGRFRSLLAVIPNLVDMDRIDEGRLMEPPQAVRDIPGQRRIIGWCGRLSDVKSPLRALEVLRVLHDRRLHDTHLLFIGDGPMRSELEERARELKLADFVTFTGYMANPVPALMLCKLGLLTSDVEGFPNVILEMLASNVGGIATTNCAGGLQGIPSLQIAEAPTPNALADALERAYAHDRSPLTSHFIESRKPSTYFQCIMANK